jgi:glycosyltransferase involved in cell wall biosynthesis
MSEPSMTAPLTTDPLKTARIALIAHRFQHNDGQGRVNYEVARAALEQGFDLTLLCAYCAPDLANHPNATVVTIGREKLPTQLLRNLAFAQDSAAWLRAHQGEFDLVQANGFITWEPCDIVTAHFVHTDWARSVYFPFRGFTLSPYALYQKAFTKANSAWEKRAFTTARRVIAVSEVVGHEVHKLGVPESRIAVIYNGVDTDECQPGAGDRKAFGLPEGVPLALFVGEIRTPRKNLDTLLKAMVSVPGMHLAVAGETRDSPFITMAAELGLAARVHFIGKTKQIALLMRSVDLFVFPSRYEAHPLVVLEAMASGLPIIISANVGSAKSFTGVFDLLQDPDDAAALAGLINELLANPARMRAMGAGARARALELQWSVTVEQYFDVYRELLTEGKS